MLTGIFMAFLAMLILVTLTLVISLTWVDRVQSEREFEDWRRKQARLENQVRERATRHSVRRHLTAVKREDQ